MLLFAAGAIYVISLGSVSLLARLFWTFLASTMAVVGLTWLVLYLIDAGAEIIETAQARGRQCRHPPLGDAA